MNRPLINMELGLLKKNRSGQRRATTVLRNVVILLLVFAQLFGLGIGQGFAANGQPLRPGGAPAPAPSPQARAVPPSAQVGLVSLNFTGADLVEVIHVLAQYLKLNYTIDPGVRGTVTLYSAQPLRQPDLLPIFHQVLRMNDAVAVKTGEFYHIAPINAGKGMVRPARRLGERGYILQVVPIRFFSVSEIKRLLEPFITPGGEIIEYPRGNFLIILDLATNIQRLLEIKDLIDVNVFAGVRMELYQPKVASAEELADEMGRIMQAYAASTTQSENFVAQFIAVPRINRLLVISHSEAAWSYAMRWLERIDTYAEGPGRRIFVYPVENGKAVDLADILNQVLGQGSTGSRGPQRTLSDYAERIAGGLQNTPSGGSSAGQTGGGPAQSGSAFAVAPTQAQPPQARPRTGAGGDPTAGTAGGANEQVRIVPDPATNSLIIFGTGQEFQNIRNILKEIDIVPRQVLIDVMIAEVSLEDDLEFGIEYQILRDNVEIFGRDFNQHISLLSGIPAALPGGWSAIIGTGSSIRAFINARRADSRIKVLSSPTILATDSQPARIQVGSEEPIATGTVTSPVSTGVTSSTTIQYRNTGSILTIIPQVNAQGLINLQVKMEVSQRGASVVVGQDSFPSFDTRDAETTAVVQDGETLAIGGIITERVNRSRLGIPFLMDIPVFGRFFGRTTDDIDRTELIMLITPHVIRSKEEARTVTEEFKDVLSHVVREYGWEIENMKRQKRRGQEQQPQPEPQKAPTVEPQSSIVPQQQEPQKSARNVTILVPTDQKAYESLSTSLASLAPAKEFAVPGREVKAPTESSQQSHVVVLGNNGIEKGHELGKGIVQADEGTTPTAKAEIPYLEADLTSLGGEQKNPSEKTGAEQRDKSLTLLREDFSKAPSADRMASAPEGKNTFTDELLSAVIRDLEERQGRGYREKDKKTRTEQVDAPMASVQEGQKKPEESAGVSTVWQQVVSSFVDSSSTGHKTSPRENLADSEAGEKVSLSTEEPMEPSFENEVTASLVDETSVQEAKDPIARELLKGTSKDRKKASPSETDKTGKSGKTDTSKASVRDESEKKGLEPRAAIPSVQELKAALGQLARPSKVVEKPAHGNQSVAPAITAKASTAKETEASAEKKLTAAPVEKVPAPEVTASIKTEDLSNAKKAVEKKEKIDTVKKADEKTIPAEKVESEKLARKGSEKVSTPTQAEPIPSKSKVAASVEPKPEVAAKKDGVASKGGEKPAKEKEQTASATKAKASVKPPQKIETPAKEELTQSPVTQKAPAKIDVTTAASTTKKQLSKVVDTKGQVKKKVEVKADSREKDAPKPLAMAEPTEILTKDAVLEATTKPTEVSQATSKTSVESTKPSVPAEQSSSEVGATDSTEVAETSPPKKTSWSPLSWFWRSKPVPSGQDETERGPVKPEEVAKVGPTGAAKDNFIPAGSTDLPSSAKDPVSSSVKVPAPEVAPVTEARVSEVSKRPGVNQEEPTDVEAPGDEIVSLVPTDKTPFSDANADSATKEKTPSSEQTSWSPRGWYSRAVESVTSSPKGTQESPLELKEVPKTESTETVNDNAIPSGIAGLPTPGEQPVSSPVKNKTPIPELPPITEARVAKVSEEPQAEQREPQEKEPANDAIVSSTPAEEFLPKDIKVAKTDHEETASSEQRNWSPLGWFSRSKPVTLSQEENRKTPEDLGEVAKVGTNEVSNLEDVSSEGKEQTSPAEEPVQSAFREAPVPEQAEFVTRVTINRDQLSEGVNQTQADESVEAITGVSEMGSSESLAQGKASEPKMQWDAGKVPVITNEVLDAFSQESPPVTSSLAPTETPTLKSEIASSAVRGEPSPSKKTGWLPLGWWSQAESVTSTQEKSEGSPEEPIEVARAKQPEVETLSQEPGPVSPEELPSTAELATTEGSETKSQSKTSWSPLSWFSRSEPVNSAEEKTGESSGESIEAAQPEQGVFENTTHETATSFGTTGEIPFKEEQPSLEATVTSPVEGVASSAVGGVASTSVESESIAQKWLPTVGIRFERKKDELPQESFAGEELTNSGVGEGTITVEQTGETPEVVGQVVPFDKEAAEALRQIPSGPVESPFTTEESAPVQTSDVEQPDAEVAQAERHIESRVLRFPRHDISREYQTDPVQAEQEVPMRLAVSEVGSYSSVSPETESFAQRTEPRRNSTGKTVRYTAKQNPLSSKTGRQGKWSVQIRAYARAGRARGLVNRLQNSGYDAYVVGAKVNGRYWYRVRVGHFDSKRKAKATLASIKKNKTYSQAYVVVNR